VREVGAADGGPEALDLLARIRAQQGRLDDAEASWTELRRTAPDHAPAAAGLRRIAALRTKHGGGHVLAVLAILIAAFLIFPARITDTGERAGRAVGGGPEPGLALAPAPALPALDVAGSVVSTEAGARVIRFPEGLFSRGSELRPGARETLVELGRQLAPIAATHALTVTGLADDRTLRPGAAWRDNVALGLARAAVALDALREHAPFPPEAVTLRAATEVPPGLDPSARRARRSVELRLAPRGAP
jgi:type VI secretion system protein ImpK